MKKLKLVFSTAVLCFTLVTVTMPFWRSAFTEKASLESAYAYGLFWGVLLASVFVAFVVNWRNFEVKE